jgi:hypothetical protein
MSFLCVLSLRVYLLLLVLLINFIRILTTTITMPSPGQVRSGVARVKSKGRQTDRYASEASGFFSLTRSQSSKSSFYRPRTSYAVGVTRSFYSSDVKIQQKCNKEFHVGASGELPLAAVGRTYVHTGALDHIVCWERNCYMKRRIVL